jgi:hypothetical protein
LHDLLGSDIIVPEIAGMGLGFEGRYLLFLRIEVKDTPASWSTLP